MKLSTGVDVAVTIKEVAKQEHINLFSIPKAKTIKVTKLEMQVVDVLRNNVKNNRPLILCSFQMYKVAIPLLITHARKMIKSNHLIIFQGLTIDWKVRMYSND